MDLVQSIHTSVPPMPALCMSACCPLPAPGVPIAPTELYLPGFPNPTRVFRRPNGPLETAQIEPARLRFAAAQPTVPTSAMHLHTAIESARKRYDELLMQGRCDQAADAPNSVLASAAEVHGKTTTRCWGCAQPGCGSWSLGSEHRCARSEFDELAEAYLRIEVGSVNQPGIAALARPAATSRWATSMVVSPHCARCSMR